MNQNAMNQNAMNQNAMNQNAMNQNAMNQNAMNQSVRQCIKRRFADLSSAMGRMVMIFVAVFFLASCSLFPTKQAVPGGGGNDAQQITASIGSSDCPNLCAGTFWRTANVAAIRSAILDENVNGRSFYGWAPLHYAARDSKAAEIIIALLEKGADAKVQTKDGETAYSLIKNNNSLENTEAYQHLRRLDSQ